MSTGAVHGNRKGGADVAHAVIGQPAKPGDEDRDRDTLDGVQVDRGTPRNRIFARVEDNLTGQSSDRGGAWRDEHAPKPWDCRVTGEDDDWSAPNFSYLAPPHLTSHGKRAHEAAAARRNDARSPHSSGSSAGCSS